MKTFLYILALSPGTRDLVHRTVPDLQIDMLVKWKPLLLLSLLIWIWYLLPAWLLSIDPTAISF